MELVFVLSLVDPFSNPLLEVSYSISFASFVRILHHCFDQLFCSIAEALSRLNAVITHPDAQHSDNVMAYDNAVSALGKICQFHRDSINAAQVLRILVLHIFTVIWSAVLIVLILHVIIMHMFVLAFVQRMFSKRKVRVAFVKIALECSIWHCSVYKKLIQTCYISFEQVWVASHTAWLEWLLC